MDKSNIVNIMTVIVAIILIGGYFLICVIPYFEEQARIEDCTFSCNESRYIFMEMGPNDVCICFDDNNDLKYVARLKNND